MVAQCAVSQDRPVVVMVGRPPGAVETRAADLIQATLGPRREGAVRIGRDLHKPTHRPYAALLDQHTALRGPGTGWDPSQWHHSGLTHLGEQGESELMPMAEPRHKKAGKVRRCSEPSPEAVTGFTSPLAPDDTDAEAPFRRGPLRAASQVQRGRRCTTPASAVVTSLLTVAVVGGSGSRSANRRCPPPTKERVSESISASAEMRPIARSSAR